ncbi:hypothetical protein HDE_04382 [Halotydeus destructor]|nr:hypothetical protein HDE_04382 [Halotydeus destructor]
MRSLNLVLIFLFLCSSNAAHRREHPGEHEIIKWVIDHAVTYGSLGQVPVNLSTFGLFPPKPEPGQHLILTPVTLEDCTLYDLDSIVQEGSVSVTSTPAGLTIKGRLVSEDVFMMCMGHFEYRRSLNSGNDPWDETVEVGDIPMLVHTLSGATGLTYDFVFTIDHYNQLNVEALNLNKVPKWVVRIMCPMGQKNVCRLIKERLPIQIHEHFKAWVEYYLARTFALATFPAAANFSATQAPSVSTRGTTASPAFSFVPYARPTTVQPTYRRIESRPTTRREFTHLPTTPSSVTKFVATATPSTTATPSVTTRAPSIAPMKHSEFSSGRTEFRNFSDNYHQQASSAAHRPTKPAAAQPEQHAVQYDRQPAAQPIRPPYGQPTRQPALQPTKPAERPTFLITEQHDHSHRQQPTPSPYRPMATAAPHPVTTERYRHQHSHEHPPKQRFESPLTTTSRTESSHYRDHAQCSSLPLPATL